jgi:hypothetical protein
MDTSERIKKETRGEEGKRTPILKEKIQIYVRIS